MAKLLVFSSQPRDTGARPPRDAYDSTGRLEARKSAPHIDLDRIHRHFEAPLDLVELYRANLIDPPSALRLALREFVADCKARPDFAAACALIGLLAGLAVTFGLAELLILAGAV